MQIEDLIKQQRDELDIENPPTELWDNIRKEWKGEKFSKQPIYWWKVAALIFITTSFGLLLYTFSLHNKVEKLASLGDISAEYKEVQVKYEQEIATLESSVPIQNVKQDDDFFWITQEMKTLEEINQLYRKDIGKAADQAQLVEALVDYYEKKINLLKKLELEINRTQKFIKDEKDTTDTISL